MDFFLIDPKLYRELFVRVGEEVGNISQVGRYVVANLDFHPRVTGNDYYLRLGWLCGTIKPFMDFDLMQAFPLFGEL